MKRFSQEFMYSTTAWRPLIDIFERGDSILIVVELPGIEKEAISVTIDRGVLTIRGFRPKRVPENTLCVHQMEVPYGPFERSVALPACADLQRVEAKHEEGYLTIEIPRKVDR